MRQQRNYVSTTVYLHRDDLDELRRLSVVTGVPMAVMIRDSVEATLVKFRKMAEVVEGSDEVL
jgi:hypothetical protein